jgi:DNA-binding MarR family transcriptional regulator
MDAAIAHRMGLTGSDLLALKHLLVSDEAMGPVDLGRKLGITSGAATGLVARLEQAGYVRREPHPRDGRRQIVSATSRARSEMLERLQPLAEAINQAAARLGTQQRRVVIDMLGELAEVHRRYAR